MQLHWDWVDLPTFNRSKGDRDLEVAQRGADTVAHVVDWCAAFLTEPAKDSVQSYYAAPFPCILTSELHDATLQFFFARRLNQVTRYVSDWSSRSTVSFLAEALPILSPLSFLLNIHG